MHVGQYLVLNWPESSHLQGRTRKEYPNELSDALATRNDSNALGMNAFLKVANHTMSVLDERICGVSSVSLAQKLYKSQ